MAKPVPKSDNIVSNVTNSKPGCGPVELETEEFDTGRSKLNGGQWNEGIPDLISPKFYQYEIELLKYIWTGTLDCKKNLLN